MNRKAADRVASGHPWIFSSDVLDRGQAEAGDAVLVTDPKGAALGVAHYSAASQICLRLLADRVQTIDRGVLPGTHGRRRSASEARRAQAQTLTGWCTRKPTCCPGW